MGVLFNPVYWFYGLIFLVIAIFIAVASYRLVKGRGVSAAFAVIVALPVFFLVFCNLCGWSLNIPSPWFRPAASDIVGVWEMTPTKLQEVSGREGGEISLSTLEFKADNTFRVTGMTDWWSDGDLKELVERFKTDSGIWKIKKNDGEWGIELNSGVWLNLRGYFAPYTIYIITGDPDIGDNIIEFKRRSTE